MKKQKQMKYECICEHCHISYQSVIELSSYCPSCFGYVMRSLTTKQYIAWLKNAYTRIQNGLELNFFDSMCIGDKETYCCWGMCNDDLDAWPDKDMWKVPDQSKLWLRTFMSSNGERIVSQIHHIKHDYHYCPFDKDLNLETVKYCSHGCFYRCAIFKNGNKLSKEDALLLIQKALDLYQNKE